MKLFNRSEQASNENDKTQRMITIIKKLQQNNLGDRSRLENMLIDLEEGLPLNNEAKLYLKTLYEQYKAQRHAPQQAQQPKTEPAVEYLDQAENSTLNKANSGMISADLNISEIVNFAKRLKTMNVGESWRLDYVINTLERGDPLFPSDLAYVQDLILKYFNINARMPTNQKSKTTKNNTKPQDKRQKSTMGRIQNFKSIFNILSPPAFVNSALLAARLGIAFVFIWAGLDKITNPFVTLTMIEDLSLGLTLTAENITMFGFVEIASAAMVLAGIATRIGAAIHLAILIAVQVLFGFTYQVGPSVWKDPALIGIASLLIVCGSGRFGVDELLKKIAKKEQKESKQPNLPKNEYLFERKIHENTSDISEMGNLVREIKQESTIIRNVPVSERTKSHDSDKQLYNKADERNDLESRLEAKIIEIEQLKHNLEAVLDDLKDLRQNPNLVSAQHDSLSQSGHK
ncbi:MAG: DoxX family protein [Thermoproteota archaeon]